MDKLMQEKLLAVVEESDRLASVMSTQEVASDPDTYRKYAQAHSGYADVVAAYRRWEDQSKALAEADQILREESDEMLREMAEEEHESLSASLQALELELRLLLLPKDPNDDKNTIVEIRAGTGGDEAGLFAADLFRMYTRYAEKCGWKLEIMNSNETQLGGFKEISFQLSGDHVYRLMKWEAGVHRVQRVPDTETQGRVHTSAVTVAVLPEADAVEVDINAGDLQIDVYRSSGPGGQSVNTTDSAVRITHKPTGTVVTCQDEKSQHKNKAKALKVLAARLLDLMQQEEASVRSSERRNQVGSGDRSERIRTYNFPQNRLTDHRIKLTLHSLDRAMEGEIQDLFDALAEADREARLAEAL